MGEFIEQRFERCQFHGRGIGAGAIEGRKPKWNSVCRCFLMHASLDAEALETAALCNTVLPDATISKRDCAD